MKNSLFKRAFAAVATVPLALTQCLSVANAVNVNDAIIISAKTAPAENEYSVETIRWMDPTEDDGAMYSLAEVVRYDSNGDGKIDENDEIDSVIYTKKSYWNTNIGIALDTIEGKAPSDTIDLTPVFDEVISSAGKYADIAQNVVNKIGDAKYTINNRTVTVTAALDNITPVFEDFLQGKVSAELKELADKYGVEELDGVTFFDGIDISGDFFVEIETINGAEDRTLTGRVTFTDETGKVWSGAKIADYFNIKMDELQNSTASTINELKEKYDLTEEDIKNLVQASQEFEDIVSKAKAYMTKGINKYYDMKDFTGEYHFDNYADMAQAINNNELFNKGLDYIDNKAPDNITDKLPDRIPEDLDVIAQSQAVQNAFIKVINIIASKVDGITINLAPADVTELIESITNIDIAANAGTVTFDGDLPDNEEADAISYVITTYGNEIEGYELVAEGANSHKEADVEIDFNELDTNGSASATFELNRKVEIKVKKKELTTTTTDVTTTVDPTLTTTVDPTLTTTVDPTVTTTSDNGSGSVTTTSDNGSGSVTTTSDNGSGSVTTTSDNGSGSVTTTSDNGSGSVTTTSDNGSGSVTTTSDNGSGSVTTTSDNGSGSVTTTSDNGSGSVTTTSDNGSGSVTTTSDNGSGSVTTTSDNGSGAVTTTSSDIVIVGTTTVSAELISVEVSVETVDGFYLSIDKKFNEEQVQSLTYSAVVRHVITDEADNIIKDTSEVVKGDLMGKFKFDDTPESVFTPVADGEKATIDNFKYTVALYAAEDIVDGDVTIFAANDAIATTNGSDAPINAAINAYIGVKGDANLSGKSLSDDASVVLTWYATASTGGNESMAFTTSELAVDPDTSEIIDATLDRFAAFLADTDNENDPDNWKSDVLKTKRQVSAADASFILTTYSLVSTGAVEGDYATRELWNEVLGEEFAKVED